jgi:hypothetical protein
MFTAKALLDEIRNPAVAYPLPFDNTSPRFLLLAGPVQALYLMHIIFNHRVVLGANPPGSLRNSIHTNYGYL